MLMPSIFGENLFDDFFNDFPFYNDRDMKKAERKLYGHRAKNLMKTDIKEKATATFWRWIFRDSKKTRFRCPWKTVI